MSTSEDQISLSTLNRLIREVLEGNFLEDVWVVAEIAEIKPSSNGHCYLELVEKKNDKILARMKANIWSFQYQRISTEFFSYTGKNLEKGMQVLLKAAVNFHELYGISLVVKNIDVNFTIGNIERLKKETIEKLKREGLLDKNKELILELIPKRIAVISSENAAGYEDFISQLKHNSYGFCFETTLFPCVMQGEKTEASIIHALEKINSNISNFDAITIIRGGGATLDLNAFDNYNLAKAIAQFPLPIISGIGHEKDYSIVDYVVHTRLKTPTAVAEFFIQKFLDFDEYISGLRDALVFLCRERLSNEKNKNTNYSAKFVMSSQSFLKINSQKFMLLERRLPTLISIKIEKLKQNLSIYNKSLIQLPRFFIKEKNQNIAVLKNDFLKSYKHFIQKKDSEIKQINQQINLLNPENVLKRGYVIVKNVDGKILKTKNQLSELDKVTLQFKDGEIKAQIKNI